MVSGSNDDVQPVVEMFPSGQAAQTILPVRVLDTSLASNQNQAVGLRLELFDSDSARAEDSADVVGASAAVMRWFVRQVDLVLDRVDRVR